MPTSSNSRVQEPTATLRVPIFMSQNVFVFGTLKKGFPLQEQGLRDAAFLGSYSTCLRFPLVIAGPRFAPMMFNEPGVGFRVIGELYAVDDQTLINLDRLESVGLPGNMRVAIDVQPIGRGRSVCAYAYLKSRNLAQLMHSRYLQIYEDRRILAEAARNDDHD